MKSDQQHGHSALQNISPPIALDISSLSLSEKESDWCFMYCGDCHSLTRIRGDDGPKFLNAIASCEGCGSLREV